MITVQLLGGACLRADGAVLCGPPAQRHRVALLALIVEAWPRPLRRDRAVALLWPERDEAGARRLLNLAVHVLRSALGEDAIASVSDGLCFEPSLVRCDLHELREAIAADEPERIVRLYAGPLLDGFHLAESAEFAHWLDDRRAELVHAYRRALLALLGRQERAGDAHGLVATCRRLVGADPHSTEYARRLMRALDAVGDRAAAIQHAADHTRRLKADLDLGPDPDVVALADELRRAPGRSEGASVAVLPFINLGGQPEHEYFADGITEDVIAHLSKIRALKVIARGSVMPFKSRGATLAEVGRALGVSTVLDGSVRHAGDRVRIVATLVDVQHERQLWAETYDREIADIFAIQTDVALRIADALRAELSPEERGRVRSEATKDIQAYRFYLQGRQAFLQFTPEGLERGRHYYELAVARDPGFALAHAHLAMACMEMAEHATVPSRPLYERARAASARALELASDLSEAHATAGYLKMIYEFDWVAAERMLRRALELSPGSGYVIDLLARLCWSVERYDEALPLARRAQAVDPAANRVDLSTMLLRAGRYEQAIVTARDAVEVEPAAGRPRATLGWAYFLSGRREEGVAELEHAVECSGRNTQWVAQLGQAYGMQGEKTKAGAILAELEERGRHRYVSPYHFAYVYTGLGEQDRALDLLEQAVADRTGTTYSIKGSFLFAPLRPHPRFRALMRMMNLA